MAAVDEKQFPQKTHPLSRPTKGTYSSCHCQEKFPDLRPQGSLPYGSWKGPEGGVFQERKDISVIIALK